MSKINWDEYKKYVNSIVTDPLDVEQQEALFGLTKGLFLVNKNKKDKQLLAFAISTVRSAMESARNNSIVQTKEIVVNFPERFLNRYIQLFNALNSIREPFSHEDFHISYNNRDGSKLRISTELGIVSWIKKDGETLMSNNLPDNKIRLYIKFFVSGLYQPLETLEWLNKKQNNI